MILMAALLTVSLFGCGGDIDPTEKPGDSVMAPPVEEPSTQDPNQNEGSDQPGVEEGKKATFALLGKKGYEAKKQELDSQPEKNAKYIV